MESTAKDFMDKQDEPTIILEIFVAKGTPGMYIGKNTRGNRQEGEFLLARKPRLKVWERTKERIKVEVLQ